MNVALIYAIYCYSCHKSHFKHHQSHFSRWEECTREHSNITLMEDLCHKAAPKSPKDRNLEFIQHILSIYHQAAVNKKLTVRVSRGRGKRKKIQLLEEGHIYRGKILHGNIVGRWCLLYVYHCIAWVSVLPVVPKILLWVSDFGSHCSAGLSWHLYYKMYTAGIIHLHWKSSDSKLHALYIAYIFLCGLEETCFYA